MYKFEGKIKLISLIMMVIGVVAISYGFLTSPKSISDVEMEKIETHETSHGKVSSEIKEHFGADKIEMNSHNDDSHKEHVYNQMTNRPWTAIYISIFFFTAIALGATFFYALQHTAEVGWSAVLHKVMEGIASFLPVGGVLLIIVLVLSGLHMNHLFHWMQEGITDPSSTNYDSIIAGKKGFLNVPFFLIRAVIYVVVWSLLLFRMKKLSDKLDESGDLKVHRALKNTSIAFIVFFGVTSSTMAWDWIMSLDPHWFSTLFGWYIMSVYLVSAVSVIALVTIYLRSLGLLPFVNNSHLHDLAKFMFGFSILWAYLWYSQFMLYWYSNIPEEVTYFLARADGYKTPFFIAFLMSFLTPLLVLMDSDAKRKPFMVAIAAIAIILGHALEVFTLVSPGTVGSHWHLGFVEIGAFVGVFGLFLFVIFNCISKRELLAKGSPYLEESKKFHY